MVTPNYNISKIASNVEYIRDQVNMDGLLITEPWISARFTRAGYFFGKAAQALQGCCDSVYEISEADIYGASAKSAMKHHGKTTLQKIMIYSDLGKKVMGEIAAIARQMPEHEDTVLLAMGAMTMGLSQLHTATTQCRN